MVTVCVDRSFGRHSKDLYYAPIRFLSGMWQIKYLGSGNRKRADGRHNVHSHKHSVRELYLGSNEIHVGLIYSPLRGEDRILIHFIREFEDLTDEELVKALNNKGE